MNRFFIDMVVCCAKCRREAKVRAELSVSSGDLNAHVGSLCSTIQLPISKVPGDSTILAVPRPTDWRPVLQDGRQVWWCEVCVSE